MTPHYQDDWLTVYHGDARAVMAEMEPESVHCVVTSPPYWGLRDYGQPGQLGLEPTPEQYVEDMVAVFREVRRVLRSDGTVWLNLGDSYSGNGGGVTTGKGALRPDQQAYKKWERDWGGLKPKDLVGIPWRVAFALQQPYYTGSIKAETDRTWLAALIDGEGTFTILSTTSSSSASISYPPIVQVRMTSQSVVQKAASLVGVVSPAQYPPSGGSNRAVYQWRLAGRRAADVARELYPYLIEKRRQAMVVWNHQEIRDGYTTKRGVHMPDEARAKQQLCRELIRRLNRGEDVDLPSWMVEPPSLLEPGWYLRSDVIWSKPNPMPESVTDRPTKSHEYLFLLSKSARYYYDADAVREPHRWQDPELLATNAQARQGLRLAQRREAGDMSAVRQQPELGREKGRGKNGNAESEFSASTAGRNLRSVWSIATAPYPGAHFATFPPKLVEPCIKAGCPEGGVVLDPFAGSGTTGMVAQSLSRRAVLIDLSMDYLDQLLRRNRDIPLGLTG